MLASQKITPTLFSSLAQRFTRSNPRKPAGKRLRREHASAAALENLESRILMSVTNTFSNGNLSIQGDSANDAIVINFTNNAGTALNYQVGNNIYNFSGVNHLVLNGGAGTNSFTLNGAAGGNTIDVTNYNTAWDSINIHTDNFSSLTINSGVDNDHVSIGGSYWNQTVNVNGVNGNDTVTIGDDGLAYNVAGKVNVANTGGYTNLTVDSSADTNPENAKLRDNSVIGLNYGGIYYNPNDINNLVVQGGSAGNTFTVSNLPGSITTTLITGKGDDTTYVQSTNLNSSLNVDGDRGQDQLFVGLNNNTQSVQGDLYVNESGGGFVTLNINDSADTLARTVDMSVTNHIGHITGLTGGDLSYFWGSFNGLNIYGGHAALGQGDTFNVNGTPANGYSAIYGSTGTDLFNINTVGAANANGSLYINGGGNADSVNVGNGDTSGIHGNLAITNPLGTIFSLNVDNSKSAAIQNVTLDTTRITNIADGLILYQNVNSLQIKTSKNSTVTVQNTAANTATTINTAAGNSYVYVDKVAANSPLYVTATGGTENLILGWYNGTTPADILSKVTAANPAGILNITVHAENATALKPTITAYGITGLFGPAAAHTALSYSSVNLLNIYTGTGSDLFTVIGSPSNVIFNLASGGSGNSGVQLFYATPGAKLKVNAGAPNQGVFIYDSNANLSLAGQSHAINLTLDGSSETLGRHIVVGSNGITGRGNGSITYSSTVLNSLTLFAGKAHDVIDVNAPLFTSTINAGAGDDTINALAAGANSIFNGQAGNDTIDARTLYTHATLNGVEGNDFLWSNNTVKDTLIGGNGFDTAFADIFDATSGIENLFTGTIYGTVRNDVNGNGKTDIGDLGIAGRTVYVDLNNNNIHDANEPSTITNSAGAYSLSGLLTGSFRVREVLPVGVRETAGSTTPVHVINGSAFGSGGPAFLTTANAANIANGFNFSILSGSILNHLLFGSH